MKLNQHPDVYRLEESPADFGLENYQKAVSEREKAREKAIRDLGVGDDLLRLRNKLAPAGVSDDIEGKLGLLKQDVGPLDQEYAEWLRQHPDLGKEIMTAEGEYKKTWAEIFSTVKKWGSRAFEIVENIASGLLKILKFIPKTTLVLGIALLVLGGGTIAGLELLKIAETQGFGFIKTQLIALLGEHFIDWENFESIAKGVHEFFTGLDNSGNAGGGVHLGKPIG